MSKTRKNKLKQNNPDTDKLPPHSIEAEQGVLGCILLRPACMDICRQKFGHQGVFYDLRHQAIFDAMVEVSKNGGIDTIHLGEYLKDVGTLEEVGGYDYFTSLQDKTPSSENLPVYLDIVWEKFQQRRIVQVCGEVIERINLGNANIEDLMFATRSDLAQIFDTQKAAEQAWTIKQLNDFNADKDPNALIGMKDGRASRYLCRGYGAWLIGPSGVGKSSLIHQAAFSWALGKSMCGISAVRPLRVLIVQAENDEGDAAEMTQGILRSFNISEWDDTNGFDLLNDNVKVITERCMTGERFCDWLGKQIELFRADIVFGDPFLSFAGIDVTRLDQCSKFLRQHLNPVLASTGAILFASHHTGKPKFDKHVKQPTAIDYAYAGIGSSELVNWARAVMVLLQLGDGIHYELKLAKRGPRAGAQHPSGEFTTSIFLRHAKDRIFWEQVDAPEAKAADDKPRTGGKPDKKEEIASSNLHGFLSKCTPEGEGLNQISKRLEVWLASQDLDISPSTCKRIIPILVQRGKLTKNSELLYVKGKQA